MRQFRIYLDTSVFGGCFDNEFAEESLRLVQAIHDGKLVAVLTDVVVEELADAPQQVRDVLLSFPVEAIERIELTEPVIALRDAYVRAGIVSERFRADAGHVAAATVARVDALVSWNFRHIVRLDKMKAYNQVNLLEGYGILTIVTPREVLPDVVPEE